MDLVRAHNKPKTLLCLSSGWKRVRVRAPARTKMPQLKVVLAAGCPGSLGPAREVANALPSGSTLVPEGAVDGALICLYGKEAASGVGPVPPKKQVRLPAPNATRLKTAVAGVALKGRLPALRACPARRPSSTFISVTVGILTSGIRRPAVRLWTTGPSARSSPETPPFTPDSAPYSGG